MPHRRDAGHHIINKYISGLKEIKVRGRLCRVADAPAAEQLIEGGREVGWQVWQSLCSNRTPAAAQQRVSQQHRDEGSQTKPKTKSELVLVCKEAAENVTGCNLQGIFYKTHSRPNNLSPMDQNL